MNINDFEKTMTIFFSKSTGKIKALCQGTQGFDYFGEDAGDMEIILDRLVTEYNPKVTANMELFMVVDGKLEVNASALQKLIG